MAKQTCQFPLQAALAALLQVVAEQVVYCPPPLVQLQGAARTGSRPQLASQVTLEGARQARLARVSPFLQVFPVPQTSL